MIEKNLLEVVAEALQNVLSNPEETLEKIQSEGGIIRPQKDVSGQGRVIGELTPAMLLLHHYWRENESKAELIKAQAQSLAQRGGDTSELETEYVKVRTLEELGRRGFWIAVNDGLGVWDTENLAVGRIAGRSVVIERNEEKSHRSIMVGIGGPADLLRTIFESLSEDCGNPECPIHHPENRAKETEETEETEN